MLLGLENSHANSEFLAIFVAKYKNIKEFGLYICISQFFFVILRAEIRMCVQCVCIRAEMYS